MHPSVVYPLRPRSIRKKAVHHRDVGWQLRLQASLDGELSERSTNMVARNREAEVLSRELAMVKSLLTGAEIQRPLPRPRDCYWRWIECAIMTRSWRPLKGKALDSRVWKIKGRLKEH